MSSSPPPLPPPSSPSGGNDKENTAPPILSLDTMWSANASTELQNDGAWYYPYQHDENPHQRHAPPHTAYPPHPPHHHHHPHHQHQWSDEFGSWGTSSNSYSSTANNYEFSQQGSFVRREGERLNHHHHNNHGSSNHGDYYYYPPPSPYHRHHPHPPPPFWRQGTVPPPPPLPPPRRVPPPPPPPRRHQANSYPQHSQKQPPTPSLRGTPETPADGAKNNPSATTRPPSSTSPTPLRSNKSGEVLNNAAAATTTTTDSREEDPTNEPSVAAVGISDKATQPTTTVVEKKNGPKEQSDDPQSKLTRPKENNLNQIFFLMDDDDDDEGEDDKNEEAVVESTTATSGTTSTTPPTTPTVEQGAPLPEAGISPHHGLASATELPKQPPLLTPLRLTCDHNHPQGGPVESSELAAAQAETLRLQEDTTTATRAPQEMAIISSTTTSSSSHHYSEAGFVLTPGLVPYHQHQHQQRPLPLLEADSISHVLASAAELPPLQLTRDHPQDEPAESSEFAAAAQAETLRLQEDTTTATSALQKMVITSTTSSSDADFVHSPGLAGYHQYQQQYHRQHRRPLPLQRLRLDGDSGNCYSGDLWSNETSSYFSTVPPWAVFFGNATKDGFGDERLTVDSTAFATTITAGMNESKMDYAKVARTIASNPTIGEDEEQAAPGALEFLNNSTSFHRAVQLNSPDEYQSAIEHITEQEAQDQEGYRDLAERAEAILRGMLNKKGLVGDPHRHVEPNECCYFSVMKAYKKARLPERAEAILRLMFEDWGSGNLTAEPSARCFSQVLRAWLKSKCSTAPQHCERILREMYKLSDTQRLPLCKPNVHSVAVVLNCWTDSGEHESATRAAIIFRQMKTRFLNGDDDLRPENFCYAFILNAFVDESKIEAAEDLLWEMVDDFLDGNERAKPRIRDLNTILAMYACSGTEDAAARAECVVSRFRELYDTGALRLHPDGYTILWLSRLLKTWMATTTTAGSHSGKVIKSGGDKKPPALCLEWLRNLDKSARISTSLYTSVIESLVERGDRDGAHGILELMIDECGVVAANKNKIQRIQTDHQIFDLVISAYAGGFLCKGRPDPRTGEAIMRQMWYLSEQKSSSNHNLRPRLSTYEILINANAKGNNAKRADDLLWEMVEKKIGYPSQELLETVAKAWKTSRHPDQQRQLHKVNCFKKKLYGKKTQQQQLSSKR